MSEPSLFDPAPEPVEPYYQDGEHTSGWSRTDTSRAGAKRRTAKQKPIREYIEAAGFRGATRKELVPLFPDDDGGSVSGALSNLHQKGHIACLAESRLGNKVYVMPSLIDGRETEPFIVKPTRKELAQAAFLAGAAAAWLSQSGKRMSFDQWWESQ